MYKDLILWREYELEIEIYDHFSSQVMSKLDIEKFGETVYINFRERKN